VITEGDGPPTEFYYDGKQMIAYALQEDLAAVADAPPTIDEMLKCRRASPRPYLCGGRSLPRS
jgi:hypothetical protein